MICQHIEKRLKELLEDCGDKIEECSWILDSVVFAIQFSWYVATPRDGYQCDHTVWG